LDHFQLAGLKVDVRPAEPEELPAAQAEAERQDVQRVEPVVPSGLEDGTSLRDGQAAIDLVLGHRDLDELGDVASDDLLSYGALQGVPKDGVDELDHAHGQAGVAALTIREGAAHRLRARS